MGGLWSPAGTAAPGGCSGGACERLRNRRPCALVACDSYSLQLSVLASHETSSGPVALIAEPPDPHAAWQFLLPQSCHEAGEPSGCRASSPTLHHHVEPQNVSCSDQPDIIALTWRICAAQKRQAMGTFPFSFSHLLLTKVDQQPPLLSSNHHVASS